jgi:hypothetical protein
MVIRVAEPAWMLPLTVADAGRFGSVLPLCEIDFGLINGRSLSVRPSAAFSRKSSTSAPSGAVIRLVCGPLRPVLADAGELAARHGRARRAFCHPS